MKRKLSVEEFIHQEISVKPSVSLTERIRADVLDTENHICTRNKMWWIQATAIAASVVITVMLGIQIGKSYPKATFDGWNINDAQIENLALYEVEHE